MAEALLGAALLADAAYLEERHIGTADNHVYNRFRQIVANLRLAAQLVTPPQDWQWAPKKPTGIMLEASWQYTRHVPTQLRIELDHATPARRHHLKMTGRYQAMMAVVPQPGGS